LESGTALRQSLFLILGIFILLSTFRDMSKVLGFIFTCLISLLVPTIKADVYEGFADYTKSSDLLAINGGTGFSMPWMGRKTLLGSGSGIPARS
jgi:hypothetical protein